MESNLLDSLSKDIDGVLEDCVPGDDGNFLVDELIEKFIGRYGYNESLQIEIQEFITRVLKSPNCDKTVSRSKLVDIFTKTVFSETLEEDGTSDISFHESCGHFFTPHEGSSYSTPLNITSSQLKKAEDTLQGADSTIQLLESELSSQSTLNRKLSREIDMLKEMLEKRALDIEEKEDYHERLKNLEVKLNQSIKSCKKLTKDKEQLETAHSSLLIEFKMMSEKKDKFIKDMKMENSDLEARLMATVHEMEDLEHKLKHQDILLQTIDELKNDKMELMISYSKLSQNMTERSSPDSGRPPSSLAPISIEGGTSLLEELIDIQAYESRNRLFSFEYNEACVQTDKEMYHERADSSTQTDENCNCFKDLAWTRSEALTKVNSSVETLNSLPEDERRSNIQFKIDGLSGGNNFNEFCLSDSPGTHRLPLFHPGKKVTEESSDSSGEEYSMRSRFHRRETRSRGKRADTPIRCNRRKLLSKELTARRNVIIEQSCEALWEDNTTDSGLNDARSLFEDEILSDSPLPSSPLKRKMPKEDSPLLYVSESPDCRSLVVYKSSDLSRPKYQKNINFWLFVVLFGCIILTLLTGFFSVTNVYEVSPGGERYCYLSIFGYKLPIFWITYPRRNF